jgi:hypothetical protein
MSRSERHHERWLSAAVAAVFAAFWAITIVTSDPPEFRSQYVMHAVLWMLVTTPWVIAARLLWRAWRAGVRDSGVTVDGPAWLLASAVRALPDDRLDWGAAMTAELAHVQGPRARWWFAVGCARVALFPPRSPRMRLFRAGPVVTIAGLTGVSGCLAALAYLLVEHPSAAVALEPGMAAVFAAVMVGCSWLTLNPPRRLASSPLARRLGVGAALAVAAGLLPASRLALGSRFAVEMGVGPYLMFAPVMIIVLCSAIAAAIGRSFRVGVAAAVWTAVLGTLAVFVIAVPEALHWYRIDARLFLDGERYAPVGKNVGGFIACLVALPVWWLPFGVIGAGLGNAWQRRRPSTVPMT